MNTNLPGVSAMVLSYLALFVAKHRAVVRFPDAVEYNMTAADRIGRQHTYGNE